jgi:cytochrome c peroxidase
VPSKQDNVQRGVRRDGSNLTFQNTVRAISSRIELGSLQEDYAARLDHDNAGLASSAAFDPYGIYLFVALETSREVAVVDVFGRRELLRLGVGRAPQGLAVAPDGTRLYVSNFMDRTVSVFDISALVHAGGSTVTALGTLAAVGGERLSPQVLLGKQLFYDAQDPRLALDGYISCAACHHDGAGDGRVWDLSGFGEGLRNTISLQGHGSGGAGGLGQGPLHWSANFDEVQDFEGQIRGLAGGAGLLSDSAFSATQAPLGAPKAGLSAELDALAAYVASLNGFDASPFRAADGALTAGGAAGRAVFAAANCAACHGGSGFTNSAPGALVDVGTLKPTSGSRLGGALTGLDAPTLRDLWQTGPYLHDGSAPTLDGAVRAHTNVPAAQALNAADLAALVDYLRQIDGGEPPPVPPPPPNQAPTATVMPATVMPATVMPTATVMPSVTAVPAASGTPTVQPTAAPTAVSTPVPTLGGDDSSPPRATPTPVPDQTEVGGLEGVTPVYLPFVRR